ncbi:MAG: response regulator transcription factor [Acidimicrobiales bacterium]
MQDVPLRALVVDDTAEQRMALESLLQRQGFDVHTAADGETAVAVAEELAPALVLLDVGLPGMDGTEVCRRLRLFSDAYVVMVTSRDEEIDKVVGLAVGADDYLTKPYSGRELVARVGAMLRRPRHTGDAPSGADDPTPDERLARGHLVIDPAAREVRCDGEEVHLTRLEFDLLLTLANRPSMVFTRPQLIEQVWGAGWYGDEHVVDVHIKNLRRKVDRAGMPGVVKTVRGVGYRFDAGTIG